MVYRARIGGVKRAESKSGRFVDKQGTVYYGDKICVYFTLNVTKIREIF